MYYTCGDSHSKLSFEGCPVTTTWNGEVANVVTMNRIGSEPNAFAGQYGLGDGCKVIACFGEIDVRCHVWRFADRHEMGALGVMRDLVEGYRAALSSQRWLDTVVMSIVPPSPCNESTESGLYPFAGTDQQRAWSTAVMNGMLAGMCFQHGWKYLDVHRLYADRSGMLPRELSDGNVHIGDTSRVRDELERMGLLD